MPFILGRPLGKPCDAAFQHRVLDAALKLLERTDAPVSESYEEDADTHIDETEDAWSCPVTFGNKAAQSLADRVRSEIALLAPWFDKGVKERGHTSVGVSGLSMDEVVGFIEKLENGDATNDESAISNHSVSNHSISNNSISNHPISNRAGDMLKHAAEDLKAFYNEAAVAQPGASTANQLENWYWRETSAGEFIKSARLAGLESKDAGVKLSARFLLVPESQQH